MPLVVQRSLFFTLEELRYEEPATEAGIALAWPFFFGLRTVFVSRSDGRRKLAKASLRPFVGSKKAEKKVIVSSSGVHAYMSKIDQTQGRASRAIDRARGRRPPRDRGCEMTFETEARDRRVLTFCMCGIGYNKFPHIFPHSRPSWTIQRKIPSIFPMCGISANALFLTSIPHMRKIPHFFLTFPHIEIS